jgi:hypothetical protein
MLILITRHSEGERAEDRLVVRVLRFSALTSE